MTHGGAGIGRVRRGGRLWPALAIVVLSTLSSPASAQMFTDRPPPVPPTPCPIPARPSISRQAPGRHPRLPTGSLPPALTTQPSMVAVPPVNAPQGAAAPGQAVLSLSARYGKDLGNINGGLVWRIFADRPDENGTFKMIREDRNATPNLVLQPGNYVVHVSLGLVSAVRAVTLKAETDREAFVLPAGGLAHRRPRRHQQDSAEPDFVCDLQGQPVRRRRPRLAGAERRGRRRRAAAGRHLLHHLQLWRRQLGGALRHPRTAGKLTDVVVTHRAAVITLKLVSDKGGEALANTAWSVITPGGDVIKESIGAFPKVVLSEGEYRAIAKNEGKVYERPFNVVNGVDGEVEVVAR